MEEPKKKRIFDVGCISCKRFFECEGKERKGQLCVLFEERGDSKWQNVGCSQKK